MLIRSHCRAVLVCVATIAIGPAAMAQSADRGSPDPSSPADEAPEYPPPSTRWKLVAGGVAATGVFYGAAAGVSYAFPDAPGAKDLRIPVAGPWLAIAHNGCPVDEPDCSRLWVVLRTFITAIDGLAQAGGVGILLEGAFLTTQTSESTGPAEPKKPPKDVSFVAVPTTLGSRGIGIGVFGSF